MQSGEGSNALFGLQVVPFLAYAPERSEDAGFQYLRLGLCPVFQSRTFGLATFFPELPRTQANLVFEHCNH